MHEDIVNQIVANAFNGMGDSTGSDDFGLSVAWIDLADFMVDYTGTGQTSDSISTLAIEYNGGLRYALAFINQDGSRDVEAHPTHADMMEEYRAHEARYAAFEEATDDEV